MAEVNGIYIVGSGQLYAIAEAIREKTGEEVTMCVDAMPDLIRSISSGGGGGGVTCVGTDVYYGGTITVPYSPNYTPRMLVVHLDWVDGDGYNNDVYVPVRLDGSGGSVYDARWTITADSNSWKVTFTCDGSINESDYKIYEFDFSAMDEDTSFLWEACYSR